MELDEGLEEAIEASIAFLEEDDQLSAVGGGKSRRKWSGPWWHMATLFEMGEARWIPEAAIEAAFELLKDGTWERFAIDCEDAPQSEVECSKMDCCHCELAVFYMILRDWGLNLDVEIPWIREWFLKHQLPDGGLNCDPDANRDSLKSSIVSTLPPLEAILLYTDREYSEDEKRFLDEGARYLIEHGLCRSKGGGRILNEDWLKPSFPRFFEYDILRGMRFLVEWSKRREQPLPREVLLEGLELLGPYVGGKEVMVGSRVFGESGRWESDSFELLEMIGGEGQVSPWLTMEYREILKSLGG